MFRCYSLAVVLQRFPLGASFVVGLTGCGSDDQRDTKSDGGSLAPDAETPRPLKVAGGPVRLDAGRASRDSGETVLEASTGARMPSTLRYRTCLLAPVIRR